MSHKQKMDFISNVKQKYNKYFINSSVLEVGSVNINGTVRDLFDRPNNYIGLDVAPGRDVDVVCSGCV